MTKRLIATLGVMLVILASLGFVKFKQIQTAIAQGAAFQPPPEAVTTIVAKQEQWPATLSAIGTLAAVQGVTVSADLPGIVERIPFESGQAVRAGEVLAVLDTRQEQAQLAAVEAQRELARLNIRPHAGTAERAGHLARRVRPRHRRAQARPTHRSAKIQADDRAQDDPRAVLGHPRHPPGEPRPVSVRRRRRSCRCSRSNPIYVNFGVPQQDAGPDRRSAGTVRDHRRTTPRARVDRPRHGDRLGRRLRRRATSRCRRRSPTPTASCGRACSCRPRSRSARRSR